MRALSILFIIILCSFSFSLIKTTDDDYPEYYDDDSLEITDEDNLNIDTNYSKEDSLDEVKTRNKRKASKEESVFTVDISELENEIIPTEKLPDFREKKVESKNMLIINPKMQHLSNQLALGSAYKTDIFSPNWFTLIQDRSKKDSLNLKIEGHNNVNKDLILNIRQEKPDSWIIPVISCEHNFRFLSEQTAFFTNENIDKLADNIEKRASYYKVDGFYLDCLDLQLNLDFENQFLYLIQQIGIKMRQGKKRFITSLPPYSEKILHFMSHDNVINLSEFVDYFVLSIIDYNKYAKKPLNYYNAPFFWIKESINFYLGGDLKMNDENSEYTLNTKQLHSKFIIKIPFFGVSYQLQVGERARINNINSSTFLSSCLKGKKDHTLSHTWDEYGKEHLIHIVNNIGDFYLSYPTRRFFNERIKLVNDNKLAGVALDEITQGFEDFMDSF